MVYYGIICASYCIVCIRCLPNFLLINSATTCRTRCICWRKNHRAVHPISYLDTLIKTESESIEATLRRRRILFPGFVARVEHTKLPKCVMFGGLVGGAECVGGAGKRVDGVFSGRPRFRAFGINADQWTTAAQGKGNGAGRRNKRWDIFSWRNGSLQRKLGLD